MAKMAIYSQMADMAIQKMFINMADWVANRTEFDAFSTSYGQNKIFGWFLAIFLCIIGQKRKSMATGRFSSKNHEIFFGGFWHIYTAVEKLLVKLGTFLKIPDTLMTRPTKPPQSCV